MPTSSDGARPVVIEASGLGKRYRVAGRGAAQQTLREAVVSSAGSLFRGGRERRARETFWALDDVNFQIRQGENVGILGLNGAGKSTLLKILSRVTEPSHGQARISGRVGSLLEVGTGFHGELTGRENIFLYGSILGMSRAEIARKYADIVEFSGVGEFIGMPVKRYSSGMYVRLAFSVAAHLEPDILLLDEVLAVGDLPFQRKCIEFTKALQKRRATILFVSHNMFNIKNMCDRVIYLRRGKVCFDGPTSQGIELYESDCRLGALPWADLGGVASGGLSPVTITEATLMDVARAPRTMFDFGERLRLRLRYRIVEPVSAPNFIVSFVRSDGVACCNFATASDGVQVASHPGGGVIELLTPPLSLVAQQYRIEIIVRENGLGRLVCGQIAGGFHVRHPVFDHHFGVFHESGAWDIQEDGRPALPLPEEASA